MTGDYLNDVSAGTSVINASLSLAGSGGNVAPLESRIGKTSDNDESTGCTDDDDRLSRRPEDSERNGDDNDGNVDDGVVPEGKCDDGIDAPNLRPMEEADAKSPLFSPPLYRQRYAFVRDVLMARDVTSVVDFGCAEPKLLAFLKYCPSIESLIGVDLLKSELERGLEALRPLPGDYLDKRSRPLSTKLFLGSMLSKDERLVGLCDAITMVEVVEHLTPDVLEKFPSVVFGFYQPRVVVVTTPNSEFNVVFGPDFTGFRHWDHKFEWTRAEFEGWSRKIADDFGYRVEFHGIGDAPKREDEKAKVLETRSESREGSRAEDLNTSVAGEKSPSHTIEGLGAGDKKDGIEADWGDIGKCSQAAIFTRIDEKERESRAENDAPLSVNEAVRLPTGSSLRSPEDTPTVSNDDPSIPDVRNVVGEFPALKLPPSQSAKCSDDSTARLQPLELVCDYTFPYRSPIDVEDEKESQIFYYVHRMYVETLEELETQYWRYAGGEQFEDEDAVYSMPEFIASGKDWPPEEVDVDLPGLLRYPKLESLFSDVESLVGKVKELSVGQLTWRLDEDKRRLWVRVDDGGYDADEIDAHYDRPVDDERDEAERAIVVVDEEEWTQGEADDYFDGKDGSRRGSRSSSDWGSVDDRSSACPEACGDDTDEWIATEEDRINEATIGVISEKEEDNKPDSDWDEELKEESERQPKESADLRFYWQHLPPATHHHENNTTEYDQCASDFNARSVPSSRENWMSLTLQGRMSLTPGVVEGQFADAEDDESAPFPTLSRNHWRR